MLSPEWQALNKLSWQSDRQSILPLLFVLLAMLAASSGFTTVLKINQTARNSYQSANQALVSGVFFKIENRNDEQKIIKADYAALRQKGFNNLLPILRTSQVIASPDNEQVRRVELVGIDIFALSASSFMNMSGASDTTQATAGSIPPFWQAPHKILVHQNIASKFGSATWQLDNGQKLPKIHYVDSEQLGNELVLDIGVLQSLLEVTHLSELLVVGELPDKKRQALESHLPEHLKLSSFNTGEDAQQLTNSFHLNLLAMGILMFVVCMFVVMNALHLLLQKRINQFRICRQLGISRQQLFISLMIHWTIISIIMAMLGALLGAFLAQQLTPAVNQTLQNLYGVNVTYSVAGYWQYASMTIAANIIGTLCALTLPLSQLNQTLAKIRDSRGFVFKQGHHVWLIAAVALVSIAYIIPLLFSGLFASFVVVAIILFSGCSFLIYILPIALKALFKVVPKHRVMLSWSLADSVGLSRSSKIACCAFFIAVATNVGMNLMIDSFRNATEQWLNQRLIANYYLYSEEPKAFLNTLSNSGLNVRVVPRRTQAAVMNNEDIRLNSYPIDELYQASLSFEAEANNAWSSFANNQTIFISQQTANHFNLTLGDEISLSTTPSSSDTPITIKRTVVAIYYDYGNTERQLLLPEHFFDESTKSRLYGLHVALEDIDKFDDWYQEQNQLSNTNVIGVEQLLATSMRTFDRTFIITGSLNLVTLVVAAISLVTSFLLINQGSAATHSLIRSLGIANRQLSVWILFQYSLIVLLSCLMAIPFGIALSWLLINFINVQAFGWSYPLLLDSISIFKLTSASLALLVAAMVIPAYLRTKKPLLEDLKWLS
jgi:putative ABC transport system permease protein